MLIYKTNVLNIMQTSDLQYICPIYHACLRVVRVRVIRVIRVRVASTYISTYFPRAPPIKGRNATILYRIISNSPSKAKMQQHK